MPGIILVLAVLAAPSGSLASDADPPRFPLADHGPFNGLLGIPDGWSRVNGPAAEISWQIANNAMGQESGAETLLLDGETHTVTLRLQHQFAARLSLGLELPWIAHGGGFLDSAIAGWHDLFSLSEGIRPELPDNDLRYLYTRNDGEPAGVDDATSGIGDLRTSAALQLGAPGPDGRRFELTADVEWPTGSAQRLTGSGGTDIAAGLRLGQPPRRGSGRLAGLGWSVQAGVLWPGNVDQPLPPPAGRIYYYDAALAWAATQSLDLIVQVQGHGDAFQSELKMLGSEALQLGLGTLWQVSPALAVRIGVFEDIRTDTTPDLGLELAVVLRHRGRATSGLATGPLDTQ